MPVAVSDAELKLIAKLRALKEHGHGEIVIKVDGHVVKVRVSQDDFLAK